MISASLLILSTLLAISASALPPAAVAHPLGHGGAHAAPATAYPAIDHRAVINGGHGGYATGYSHPRSNAPSAYPAVDHRADMSRYYAPSGSASAASPAANIWGGL